MFVEEIFHRFTRPGKSYTGMQIALSLFRNDYPWIYDAGLDLIRILRSKKNENEKDNAINSFMELLEFTVEHPMMKEMYGIGEDVYILGREIRHFLMATKR
jgi:hypothetical protein